MFMALEEMVTVIIVRRATPSNAFGTSGDAAGRPGMSWDERGRRRIRESASGRSLAPRPPDTVGSSQLRAVVHHDPVVAVRPFVHRHHGIEPHECRSVDAKKARGIESIGNRRQGGTQAVRLASAVQHHVVPLGLHPIDSVHSRKTARPPSMTSSRRRYDDAFPRTATEGAAAWRHPRSGSVEHLSNRSRLNGLSR